MSPNCFLPISSWTRSSQDFACTHRSLWKLPGTPDSMVIAPSSSCLSISNISHDWSFLSAWMSSLPCKTSLSWLSSYLSGHLRFLRWILCISPNFKSPNVQILPWIQTLHGSLICISESAGSKQNSSNLLPSCLSSLLRGRFDSYTSCTVA